MIKILLVDDHAIVRAGLKQLLTEGNDMEVVAEAGSGTEAIKIVRDMDLDVVLLDISMPGKGGLEVLKQIKKEKPGLAVLILSMHPEDQYAIRALREGAAGYLAKQNAPDLLFTAVRKAASGVKYISEVVAEKLAMSVEANYTSTPHERLSNREFQIFQMMASGKTVTDVGEELSLSSKTISTHRSNILKKMGLKNNAELMRYAVENNIMYD